MDVLSLWNFADPKQSEQRFLAAQAEASSVDRQILATQIARTYGLRKDFEPARELLSTVLPHCGEHDEIAVRYELELGRTYCSPAHSSAELAPEDQQRARTHYQTAFDLAKAARLDYLAIDALHMIAATCEEPSEQIEANFQALAYLDGSDQPEAKRWLGSLTHNLGYALHLDGQYEAALIQFERSRDARHEAGNVAGERVARWMIAWTHRVMGQLDLALNEQLALQRELREAGETDEYVDQELEMLHQALGQVVSDDNPAKQ